MSEDATLEQQFQKERPSRLKSGPSRVKKLLRRSVPAILALAILAPTALAVGLEASLSQARAELNQIQQSGGVPAADGGVRHDQDPSLAKPAPSGGNPGPELPAYQELYPELYAQPGNLNSIDKNKVCYLTFDDGPSARTPEILDILEQYHVKATFFVVGKDTEQSKAWMRSIVEAGHTIGVHSYTHDYRKIYASVEAYLEDFAQEYRLIEEATGVPPQIFRFPGGSINAYNGQIYQEIAAEMIRRGFVYFDWNRTNGDAVRKPPAASVLADNALDKLGSSNRVIVLMHDSRSHANTVAALPAIIEGYQAAGYSLEALSPQVRPIVYAYPKP